MKSYILMAALLVVSATACSAQTVYTIPANPTNVTQLPNVCNPGGQNTYVYLTAGSIGYYVCVSPNVYQQFPAGTSTLIAANPPGGPGGTCSTTAIAYLAPSGTIYTCVGGVWVASGGGGSTCGTPIVTAGTVAPVFGSGVNCASFTITVPTTITPIGIVGSGPWFYVVTNTGQTTVTYAGVTQTGVCQPDASTVGATSIIQMVLVGTTLYPASCSSATAASLAAGIVPASNYPTGPNIAATAHNIANTPLACADTSASATAQSCTTAPSFTLGPGDTILYSTTTQNTGDLTIAVNGGSAIHVRKWQGSSVLASGDMKANVPLLLTFDGTYLEAYTIGNAPSAGFTNPMSAANQVIGSGSSSGGAASALTLPSCSGASNALDYNTSTNLFGCNSITATGTAGTNISISGTAISYNPFDTTVLKIFDTGFCNGGTAAGSANTFQGDGWIFSLTNAGTLIQPANSANTDQNHPCGVKLLSPASTSNGMYMALVQNGPNPTIPNIFASGTFVAMEMQAQAKLSATTTIRFNWGWSPSAAIPNGTSSQGCGIRYDTTLSDTGWTAWCGNGSAMATAAVTGTLNTSTHRFRMWQTTQGTVNFSVDGGATATISSDISSTAALTWAPKFWISNDGTSTTSQLDVFRAVGWFTGLAVN